MLNEAELLYGRREIEVAVDRVAAGVTDVMADRFPLVLPVMGGAVVFAGWLLPRLGFPLELDYLHATRYGDAVAGGGVDWRALPKKEISARSILLLDDILDEGITLAAIRQKLIDMGAAEVRIAVLVEKDLGREKPVRADFVGLRVPNRFVFGMGMDAQGLWRNLPAIYAMKEV